MAELTNSGRRNLLEQLLNFSEDKVYYLTSKHKEYRINGRKISPFVYAFTAHSISDISALAAPNGNGHVIGLKALTEAAVHIVIRVHGEIFNFDEAAIERLKREIISRYGKRLSVYGLNHCLELIVANTPPMDTVEFYGKPLLAITQAIGKYLNYCQQQYNEFAAELYDGEKYKSSTPANWKTYADAMPDEVAEKMKRLQRSLEAKYGDPDDMKKNFERLKELALKAKDNDDRT